MPFAMCLRTEKVFWQEVVGSTGGTYMLYFGGWSLPNSLWS